MSKYEIPYLTASIQAFAQRFSMTRQAAFRYLHEHKGLAFLIEFFDVEHLNASASPQACGTRTLAGAFT